MLRALAKNRDRLTISLYELPEPAPQHMQAQGSAAGAVQFAQQAQASHEQQGTMSSPGCGAGSQQCEEARCGSGGEPLPPAPAGPLPAPGTTCMKCRKQEAQVVARGREPLCFPCLHDQLFAKVRNAVRLHGLIQPGDTLALAFSGGPASAALLRFLAELRNPRTDRPARGKVSFSLHILHIDESTALGLGPEEAAAARASVAAAAAQYVSPAAGTAVQYHCIPLEAVFEDQGSAREAEAGRDGHAADSTAPLAALSRGDAGEQQQRRLQSLLALVRDPTGRQDLARHLRTHLLLRCAALLGCSRVARGDCASTLATRIVAAASKGCGYSLPGDVQLLDARHGPALPSFFLPLREVSARELRTLCSHWRLPLSAADSAELAAAVAGPQAEAPPVDKKNINALAAAFIAGMEAHNPGSVPNILNTISKLHAFEWNQPPAVPGQRQQRQGAAPQQQQWQQDAAPSGSTAERSADPAPGKRQQHIGTVLCPICLAPLADDELPGSSALLGSGSRCEHTSGGQGAAAAAAAAGCCLSCYAQIMAGCSAPGSGAAPAVAANGCGVSSSSPVLAALPAALSQRMAALAAAGQSAAGAVAAEPASAACDGPADASSCTLERLRSQIAEFLLE